MEANLTGKTLGDFEVQALLGRGSMARVYQARQISLGRHVALKVLQEDLFTPGANVARFLREAEAMARLEHPNIVPVYAAGEQSPYYFFAMRLVRGGTLDQSLRQGITCATALEWANDICRGLAFAHSSGVIHRDLKPTNVLISGGVALLSDFGLARLRDLSTLTQQGDVMGTPLYMSPEQTLGESAGPPADCFALGIILYEMLTAEHPFARREGPQLPPSEDRAQLFERIQKAACKHPSALVPELPRELERVILRALARRPEDRYPDAAAMQPELEEASRLMTGLERVIRCAPGSEPTDDYYSNEGTVPPRAVPAGDGSQSPHMASTLPLLHPGTSERKPASALSGPHLSEPRALASGSDRSLTVAAQTVAAQTEREREPKSAGATIPLCASSKSKTARLKFGRYSILREVGHGGQGVVYQARDPVLDRVVALKVLRGDAAAHERMVELFRNEARVAARLQHAHIITIYDFGVEGGSPYLTMQFVDGPSLDRLLEPGRPLPLDFALQVLAQIAGALSFAHQSSVIHLDVKPGNILLRGVPQELPPSAEPSRAREQADLARLFATPILTVAALKGTAGVPDAVLTDFTMARLREAACRRQEHPPAMLPAGTVAYASPEQITCGPEALSPASDIFSLGAVFYEMLTGKRLFPGEDPAVSRELVLRAVVAPPSAQTPGLPPAVDELCQRMLSRAASARLQTAAEIVQLAEGILA